MFVTGRMRDENDIYNIKKKDRSQSFVIVYSGVSWVEKCPKEIFELMERPGKIMEAIIRVVRSDTK